MQRAVMTGDAELAKRFGRLKVVKGIVRIRSSLMIRKLQGDDQQTLFRPCRLVTFAGLPDWFQDSKSSPFSLAGFAVTVIERLYQ